METIYDQIKQLENLLAMEVILLQSGVSQLSGEDKWLANDSVKDLTKALELLHQSRELVKDGATAREMAGLQPSGIVD